MARPDYPQLRPNGTSPPTEIAMVVNSLVSRLATNAVYDVPIAAGADAATVVDDRFHPAAMLIGEPDSGITGHTFAPGVLMLSVESGPARFIRIMVAG
jgi:hypothetical protein